MRGRSKSQGICAYMWLMRFALEQKLTHHDATMAQFLKTKKKIVITVCVYFGSIGKSIPSSKEPAYHIGACLCQQITLYLTLPLLPYRSQALEKCVAEFTRCGSASQYSEYEDGLSGCIISVYPGLLFSYPKRD